MRNMIEKKAMSPEDKAKLLKASIVAAVSTVGIGAFVRNIRLRKYREKAMETEKARNTIIVPVKKTKFMEGLPTPEELAESRGETAVTDEQTLIPEDVETKALTAPEEVSEMTPEEIAAKKKAILASNGRKFNFFGKAASVKKAGAEKKAVDGFLDSVIHPIDSTKRIFQTAIDKPVWFTAGALGSIYLAAMISDAINERRKQTAKARLEDARAEYVDLLEGDEKKASDGNGEGDIRDYTGLLLGSAFMIPMALSALVTNKIIQNRKNDKKKEREASDTYPDEPIILYKTSEAKEIPMTADAALAFMAVNREIMKCAELESRNASLMKAAQAIDPKLVGLVNEMMAMPENNADLASLIHGVYQNNAEAQSDAINAIVGRYLSGLGVTPKDLGTLSKDGFLSAWERRMIWKKYPKEVQDKLLALKDAKNEIEAIKSSLVTSPEFRKTIGERFADKNNKEFGTVKGQIIDAEMPNSWVGRNFKKDSLLYRFFKWLSDVFGFTDKKFTEGMNKAFDSYGKVQNEQAAGQAPASAPAKTQSAASPAPAVNPPQASSSASAHDSASKDVIRDMWLEANGQPLVTPIRPQAQTVSQQSRPSQYEQEVQQQLQDEIHAITKGFVEHSNALRNRPANEKWLERGR